MQLTLIGLTLFAASSMGVTGPVVTPGKVQTFKDWTIGCDNGLDCQAVALADEAGAETYVSVVVARPADPESALKIDVGAMDMKAGTYRVLIDGRTIATGVTKSDDEDVRLTSATAFRVARAMAKGARLSLADATGKILGSTSLSGASAAFRLMDAQQRRAGTKGALVAMGKKIRKFKPVPLPVITARKIAPDNILPDTSAIVALSENSICAGERFGSTEDTAYSLGKGPKGAQALVLLNCGAGAYNFSSGIYTARRDASGKWSFEPARFDYGATGFSNESPIPILVNANWDAATQTLSSYSKGRGLGDCGSSESYVWDGASFRLTEASFMGECRGAADWIPTWRAEVRLTD